jgi:hypothetical protein
LSARFPFECRIGAPLFFGRAKMVLARLVVPTTALLDVHSEVHRLCLPHRVARSDGELRCRGSGPRTSRSPSHRAGQLSRALRIAGKPQEIVGRVAGLRRWDGNAKLEYPIS